MSWVEEDVEADVEADVVEEEPIWRGCFVGGAGAGVTGGAGVGTGDPIDAVSGDCW